MSIAPFQGSRPGIVGKSGRPSSSTITFTTGPAWRQPSGASSPARTDVRRGSALESTTRASISSPPTVTTPAARPSSSSTRSTGVSRRTFAPASSAAALSAFVTEPMPPRA